MRDSFTRHSAIAAAACAALALAGCGSEDPAPQAKADSSTSASPSDSPSAAGSDPAASADTALGQGGWLLSLSSAGGADAEKATTTYVTYDPSTGTATAQKLPGVSTPNADVPDAALLVSGDRRWAIPDTGVARSETSSGRLTVYSTTSSATKVLDLRRLTGEGTLKPLGWAFDPRQPELLRVVDSRNRVWSLAVSGGRAAPAGTLAKGPWVFADGFNRNSGLPYVESITSDATKPAGNGKADPTPVSRAGGAVLGSGSPGLAALPASPCRLGAAFATTDGTTWEFCADSATVRAYVLAKGTTSWSPYGKPSKAVAPEAAGFGFALPPTG